MVILNVRQKLHEYNEYIMLIMNKQNRCFKEVIKDIDLYESATGARVNYSKSKGLWLGKWKNRKDNPMNIQWTNKNVKNLGVYFGNDNPILATYNMIIPSLNKKLDYWKQFKLSQIGKARVAEIFLASKLIYAMNFYPIENDLSKMIYKKKSSNSSIFHIRSSP